jgi:hypothetical protein
MKRTGLDIDNYSAYELIDDPSAAEARRSPEATIEPSSEMTNHTNDTA